MHGLNTSRENAMNYCSHRLRNLAAQVATRYEDEGKAVIAEEMVELATIIQLVAISVRRGEVYTVQGEDYVPDDPATDIPF